MNILEAMDDPNLFGPHFRGPSWAAWKVLLAAVFALPITEPAALATYRAATGRTTPPSTPFSEAALIVGRRGGKSRILALIAVYLATCRVYRPYLAPGEVATIVVLAANRSQARSIFRFVLGLLKSVPMLAVMIESDNTETIKLTNRVVIEIGTASFRTTRGYTFAAVLADEIAFWRLEETSANPDVEILRACRPGLSNLPGAILLMASSPYAKRGELYNAFRRHHGKDSARVLVWRADTRAMNPKIDAATIAEAYDADPEAARAEYGAEFRDDLSDFVTREAVEAVTYWGRSELPPEPGITYACFVDPSGGAADAMAVAVAHLRDGEVCVLDAVLEIRAPFDPEIAVEQCCALLRRFGITRVIGDRYAGEWPKARFREKGVTFEQSARPKSDLYGDLLPLLNAKRVELLDNPRLAAQLVGLERRTARSGRDSIDHAPGGHDDISNAVAGVLCGLFFDRRPALVRQSDVLTEGGALPLPKRCQYVAGIVAANKCGSVAVIYAARLRVIPGAPSLLILDHDVGPLRNGLFRDIATRLSELRDTCRAFGHIAFVPRELVRHAYAGGLPSEEIPPELEPEQLLLSASHHIAAGRVKLCTPAAEKAEASPLRAALDFRAGEIGDDPLRSAAILTIAMCLDERNPRQTVEHAR